MPAATPMAADARRKAAVLMVLLGDEAAAAIFRRMDRAAVGTLTREISALSDIPAQEAVAVLQEYAQRAQSDPSVAFGGADYAANLLVQAYGEREAGELLHNANGAPAEKPSCLQQLRRAEPSYLARLLQNEQPQTIALLLAHLGTKTASALLNLLPEAVAAEAVKRLAELRQFSPELAETVALALLHRFQSQREDTRQSYAGVKSVAEILNRGEATISRRLLASIEQANPELALSIRDQMFTFEDFIAVPEAGLREWVGQMDKRVLALALKGATPGVRNRVLGVMSGRAAEMLKEDIEAMGPIRIQEVQQAQNEGVLLARRLDAEGKMTLRAEANDQFVV